MAAKATQPGVKNNMYTLTVGDKEVTLAPGDPSSKGNNTLYELLHKRDQDGSFVNSAEITRLYDQYNNSINQKPSDDNPNPLTAIYPSLTYDSEAYKNLKSYSAAVNQRRELLKESRRKQNEHYIKMYDLAAKGGNTLSSKYNDETLPIVKEGLNFDIFDREENRLLTEAEFVRKFINNAKSGQIKNVDEWMSYDDPNYMMDEVIVEMVWVKQPEGPVVEEPRSRSTGRRIFDTQEATKDAKAAYAGMYDLLNKTQNDSYNIAADEGAGKGTTSGTFTSYSMRNALRGKSALGSATEVTQNPTYSVDIEPTTIRTDGNAIMFTRDLINQYNNTPKQNSGIILGEVTEDTDLNSIDDLGKRIFEAYIQDIKAYSANPKLGKAEDRPQAKLSYSPVFGLPEDEKKYGAYSLVINEPWLKKNFPDSFGTSNSAYNQQEIAKYTKISFAFDKEQDLSVRREGQYNFSNVLSQIENTDNQQYEDNVENGGNLRITRNINGSFDLSIQMQNYNPQTGSMEIDPNITKIDLTKFLRQNNLDNTDLDFGANYYKDFLLNKSEANTKAAKADAKINKSK